MSLEFFAEKVWLKDLRQWGCQNIWAVFKTTRQGGIIKRESINKDEDEGLNLRHSK